MGGVDGSRGPAGGGVGDTGSEMHTPRDGVPSRSTRGERCGSKLCSSVGEMGSSMLSMRRNEEEDKAARARLVEGYEARPTCLPALGGMTIPELSEYPTSHASCAGQTRAARWARFAHAVNHLPAASPCRSKARQGYQHLHKTPGHYSTISLD